MSKIHYKVVGCTGWEEGFSPKSIEIHSPFVKGWRSERYCMYPQQIVLNFESVVRVRKIQLLSHEYMIASKIELFVGNSTTSLVSDSGLDTVQYQRLGYISMSGNESNGFKSREMKSVNVNAVGQYIKLVLHTNHVNQLNLFNQVSLVAVNVIGLSNWKDSNIHGIKQHHQTKINQDDDHTAGRQPPLQVSVLDDLSFDCSQDPETAKMIRILESKKQRAVEGDQFELAKRFKIVIEQLIQVGTVLCQLEYHKRHAIEREDYDEAKKWKLEKDKLQQQSYHKLGIESLLHNKIPQGLMITDSPGSERTVNRNIEDESTDNPTHFDKQPSSFQTSHNETGHLPSLPTHQSPPVESAVIPSQIQISKSTHNTTSLDDRRLPAIDNSPQFTEYPEATQVTTLQKPEPLTDAQINDAAHAIKVLGMETVELLYSKQYQLREEGLKLVLSSLSESTGHSKTDILKAVSQILKKAFADKVMASFNLSLSILQYLLGPFTTENRLTESDISTLLDKVMPVLMTRLGDTNPRVQASSTNAILELATNDHIKALLGVHLMKPLSHEKGPGGSDKGGVLTSVDSPMRAVSWRYAKGRVELLQGFFAVVDLETAQLTLPQVMEFVNICLQHIHAKVRDSAAQLTIDLYRQYKGKVCEYLPVSPSDHIALKNPFWRNLFHQFDQVDGIKTSTESDFQRTKQKKDNKIKHLKGQLDVLKNLAQQGKQMTRDEIEDALDNDIPSSDFTLMNITIGTDTGHNDGHTVPVSDVHHTCPFCHVSRPELQQQIRMEQHYTVECPMLQQCKHCSQVVEIKHLCNHYLSLDCEASLEMSECPTCHEVYPKSQIDTHIKANRCIAPPDNCVKCPLCHANVENTNEAWVQHLMSLNAGCAKNPRRKRRNLRPKGNIQPKSITEEPVGMMVIPR